MNETIDCLQHATLRLTQEGSIKERLIAAYTEHLLDIDPRYLPECVRADFEALHTAMHRAVPLPRECAIRASVRKMSNEETLQHAALVVHVFAVLARSELDSVSVHRAPRANAAATAVVPLFAEA